MERNREWQCVRGEVFLNQLGQKNMEKKVKI